MAGLLRNIWHRTRSLLSVGDIAGALLLAMLLAALQAPESTINLDFLWAFLMWGAIFLPAWLVNATLIRWVLYKAKQSSVIGFMLAWSVALVVSIPQTVYVLFVWEQMIGESLAFEYLFVRVLIVSLCLTSLVYMLSARPVGVRIQSHASILPQSRILMDQLPPKIGNNIVSMHAEDHYIRVVTDKGAALILMRLRDAITAMDVASGMQVHRSHWIATASSPVLKRQNGKHILELNDGRTVPVSRHYLRAVRASFLAHDYY